MAKTFPEKVWYMRVLGVRVCRVLPLLDIFCWCILRPLGSFNCQGIVAVLYNFGENLDALSQITVRGGNVFHLQICAGRDSHVAVTEEVCIFFAGVSPEVTGIARLAILRLLQSPSLGWVQPPPRNAGCFAMGHSTDD